MTDVLCLDTEPGTVERLRGSGVNVVSAPFGYRNGIRYLPNPPHDFDLIVCDLTRPACFDISKWGPDGGNDNYKCTVLQGTQIDWSSRYISAEYNLAPKEELLHRLVYETQIEHMNPGSPFGTNDVLRAVSQGGVPILIFLNPEWVVRTGGHSFPSFVSLSWETAETNVTKFKVLDPLAALAAHWKSPVEIATPLRCLLKSGPTRPPGREDVLLESATVVSDRIGAVLGQFVRCGSGAIWLLPRTTNNAAMALKFVGDLRNSR